MKSAATTDVVNMDNNAAANLLTSSQGYVLHQSPGHSFKMFSAAVHSNMFSEVTTNMDLFR